MNYTATTDRRCVSCGNYLHSTGHYTSAGDKGTFGPLCLNCLRAHNRSNNNQMFNVANDLCPCCGQYLMSPEAREKVEVK